MRKIVLIGFAALGLLMVGPTASVRTTSIRHAEAGAGSVQVSRQSALAMADSNHHRAQSLLVSASRTASLARSLLVA
jgi:hypothetical protein